jgi:hypothetical protein
MREVGTVCSWLTQVMVGIGETCGFLIPDSLRWLVRVVPGMPMSLYGINVDLGEVIIDGWAGSVFYISNYRTAGVTAKFDRSYFPSVLMISNPPCEICSL